MSLQSPRIYTYKITFEEVPYYYYGVKKEKYFNEEYWGSPYANKWCWELYTPKKQILQVFPYTSEGWLEAQEVEKRLIKPVYNNDKWCLNASCGGNISLEVLTKTGTKLKQLGVGLFGLTLEQQIENGKKGGKKGGIKSKELGLGFHALTPEQMTENGKKGGTKAKELGLGFHALTPEQRSENCKKGATKVKELRIGIHGLTSEQRSENGKKGGTKGRELGTGIHGRAPEQMIEDRKKAGIKTKELGLGVHGLTSEQRRENSKKGGKKSSAQKWMCLETGYITSAGPLAQYQKARGIDTSKRIRIS